MHPPFNPKSGILKAAQHLILRHRLYYIFRPFAGSLQKLYCLSQFAGWKKQAARTALLSGYTDRFRLYTDIIKTEQLDLFSYLEFGVSKGKSMQWWCRENTNDSSHFYGFDTFEGIPENWGTKAKGSYSNHGNIPVVNDPRCTFIKGLFQESLFSFLKEHELKNRLVIHLDADLYSSTLFCLFAMLPYLKPGDILIFDEFDITTHEFRAFRDFTAACPMKYTCIGEACNYNKVVLKLKERI
jgi:hypothetical protein